MMKTRLTAPFVCLTLFLGIALAGSPGMVGEAGAAPFQIGVNNVLDKVECVASFLREEMQINVPDTFTEDSGIAATVNQMAVNGVITRDVPEDLPDIQKQDMAATAVVGETLDSLMSGGQQAYTQGFPGELAAQGFTAGQFWNILDNMSRELPNVPYDYCLPEAFEPVAEVDPEREGRPDEREDQKRPEPDPEPDDPDDPDDPDPEAGFRYYGEPYELDALDLTSSQNNGIIPFTDEVFGAESSVYRYKSESVLEGDDGGTQTVNRTETVPAAVMPLFFVQEELEEREGGNTVTMKADDNAPVMLKGVAKSDSLYKYTHEVTGYVEDGESTGVAQTTLYQNSHAIALAYGKNVNQLVNDYLQDYNRYYTDDTDNGWLGYSGVVVGIHPGGEGAGVENMVGLEGQPGEGEPRSYGVDDLSEASGGTSPGLLDDPGAYPIEAEFFGNSLAYSVWENRFDLGDDAIVYLPDPEDPNEPDNFHAYTTHYIPGELVVDRINDQHGDLETTVMDRSIINYYDEETDLRASVDAGVFKPGDFLGNVTPGSDDDFPGIENWNFTWTGDYKYGLQTVGGYAGNNDVATSDDSDNAVWTTGRSIERANADGFLAYMTQEDEHVLNQAIYDLARDIDKYDIKLNTIGDQDRLGQIKAYDAWYTQVADAQAGRVVRDRQGNLVRAQQYILRPDAQTVQVLNVSMRTGDAGNLAGLSTMDFTTTFTDGYPLGSDLKNLPWDRWLATQGADQPGPDRWVYTGSATDGIPVLANMTVKFTNPVSESLMESRSFRQREPSLPFPLQLIHSEQLMLSRKLPDGSMEDATYGFNADNSPLAAGGFGIDSLSNGFRYTFGGNQGIDVVFYETRDDSGAQGYADGYYAEEYRGVVNDIWDALRVGEPGGPMIDADMSLEIAIDRNAGTDAGFFSAPIDVVYVPMSHMAWRNDKDRSVPLGQEIPQ